jgi:nucleoside-diphosphate-sugar epimerase
LFEGLLRFMSRIIPFLNRKVFFITGATGFLAKGVVEKILRHAPDVERIYLMIRPRSRTSGKVVAPQERLEREIIQANAFGSLRQALGDGFDTLVREKLVAVSSDLTQDRLGMDDETYSLLTREVDIVINCAATVVFDEPLDVALTQNTLGPMRIVEFAKACQNATLIHVSTAYVSGQRTGKIKEETPVPNSAVAQVIGKTPNIEFDLEKEIATVLRYCDKVEADSQEPDRVAGFHRFLDKQDRGKRVTEHRRTHQVEALRQRWKRERLVARGFERARELGWHDSYTMTKAMGERMIVKTRGDLPVVIVRPSVIESSLADPEPGWLDGLKVADPLIAHYGKGRLVDFPARPDVIFDVIPVDIIVNVILGVLPTVKAEPDVKVYHVCTGDQNPMLLGDMVRLVYEYFLKNPMLDRKGRPILVKPWKYPSLETFHRRLKYRYQLPVKTLKWLLDRVSIGRLKKLKRQVSLLDATLENARALTEIYSTYVQLPCEFQTDHMQKLFEGMDAEDREIFNCDVLRIDWATYIQDIHIPGLKRHVLKFAE